MERHLVLIDRRGSNDRRKQSRFMYVRKYLQHVLRSKVRLLTNQQALGFVLS